MLDERTRKRITDLGNEELAEYIQAGTEVYRPEAIDFARHELDRRGLEPEQVAGMETDAKVRLAAKAAEVSEIATRSLGPLGKAVAFISGFLGLPLVPVFIVWLCFEHRGEKQKGRDMWTFALFGFGTLIVVVIIVAFIASMSADRVGHRLR